MRPANSLLVASCIESLGYGMSFSAMFYYMHIMATECGKNKTSILAISFALMNVGWTLPSMMSGFVQARLGYIGLFIVSSTVGLTALLVIPFLPMPNVEKEKRLFRRICGSMPCSIRRSYSHSGAEGVPRVSRRSRSAGLARGAAPPPECE